MITPEDCEAVRAFLEEHFTDSFLFGFPILGEIDGCYGLEIRQGNWNRATAERMITCLRMKADHLEEVLRSDDDNTRPPTI